MPHSEINHPTIAKTVIPECGAPLQILLHLVTFQYTYDHGMWRYGITVIAHDLQPQPDLQKSVLQIRLKPWAGLILNATSSDPGAPHSAITGIADIALRYHTICSGRHIIQTRPS
jgi:hypothetical protein